MAKDQIPQDQELKFSPNQEKIPSFLKKNLLLGMVVLGIILLLPLAIFIIGRLQNQGQITKAPGSVSKKTFAPTAPHVAAQLIVKLKESYTKEELESLRQKFDELGVVSQEKAFLSHDPLFK